MSCRMAVKISLASEVRPSHWIPFYHYVVDTDKLDNTETNFRNVSAQHSSE